MARSLGLLFRDIRNAGFAKKNFRSVGGEPDAEAMAVIIAYVTMKPLSIFQNYGDLSMRIHQRF